MNILITGGTGFIGTALCKRLAADGHNLTVLSRNPASLSPPFTGISDLSELDYQTSFDGIINLAGEPIADKRWSNRQKDIILGSRINTTSSLIEYLSLTQTKPKILISSSAIGYYGVDKSNLKVDENDHGDHSYSSQLCEQWESVARQAQSLGVRTCLLRTGIVLGRDGGALTKMLPAFRLGLGGKIGNGKQWMSWIHLSDLVGIILFCLQNPNLSGAINGTAPNPVTNAQFTKTLGEALNKPTFFSIPSVVISLLMGKMGEELLLAGKHVSPTVMQQAGFEFKYETLKDALTDIL